MSEDYKIEKGIPLVQQRRPRRLAKALTRALRAMDVGDSIKVDAAWETRATVFSRTSQEGILAGKKFMCRTLPATETEPQHYRVWRVK